MAEAVERAAGAVSATDAEVGQTVAGGGSATPMRNSRGAPLEVLADVPEIMIEGAPNSGGAADGSEMVAQSDLSADAPGGVRAQTDTADSGGPAGDTTVEGQAEVAGTALGERNEKSSNAEGTGEQVADAGGSTVGRSERGGPALGDFGPVAADVADTGTPSRPDTVSRVRPTANADPLPAAPTQEGASNPAAPREPSEPRFEL